MPRYLYTYINDPAFMQLRFFDYSQNHTEPLDEIYRTGFRVISITGLGKSKITRPSALRGTSAVVLLSEAKSEYIFLRLFRLLSRRREQTAYAWLTAAATLNIPNPTPNQSPIVIVLPPAPESLSAAIPKSWRDLLAQESKGCKM
jgi:hypothetical protein